ncbi:unnamed protein product, partial [Closterium sp. NIES-54]
GTGAVATGGAAGAGGAAGVVAGDPGAAGTGAVSAVLGGAMRPRPYYVLLLQQVLGLSPSTGPSPPLLSPSSVQSQSQLQPSSPLPGPSPYSGSTRGLTERSEPESRPASPKSPVRAVRTGRRVPRQRPPPDPSTHSMNLRPSTDPQHVPLPSPSASSLRDGLNPKSDSLRAASPTVTRFLATAVTDPLFESTASSALVAGLVDFATACRLDYATTLVAESESASVCPLSVGGECALGTDVLEDRREEFECFAVAVPHHVSMLLAPEGNPDAPDIQTPRSYAEAIEGPYSSQWQTAMDTAMASLKSTGTYVDAIPPPERTSTAILQGSLHEEIWLRRTPSFTWSFPAVTQWSLRRPVYGLRQAPREWHDTLRMTLAAPGFAPSTADPSLFLRMDTTLPPFYVLVYLEDLVFATADTEALAHVKSELLNRHNCTDLGPSPLRLHVLLATLPCAPVQLMLETHVRTAILQGSLHEEIWLRRTPSFTWSFPAVTQWSLRRPVYGLRQAPREWHDTLRMTLAAPGFAPSTADPSLFLRMDTTLPPFYVLVYLEDLVFATADTEALAHVKSELLNRHNCTDLGELTSYLGLRITRDRAQRTISLTQSHMVHQVLHRFGFTYSSPLSTPLPTGHLLSALPSDESVEPSGLASGMGLVLGGQARVVLTGHADTSYSDDLTMQRSSQGYTFSLCSGSVSWRSSLSSSVLSSSCEAEIYAGAMAAQELRWLTYLPTDVGEAPRSPPVLYVDNKAMIALC